MRNRLAVLCFGVLFAASVGGIPPPVSTPSIHSVTPPVGRPQGGERVRITGANFTPPLRVLFQFGGKSVEAFVVSVEQERILEILTPAVLLENAQHMPVDVQIISRVGTNLERKTTADDAFTYQKSSPTPLILAVAPRSVSVAGNQLVTIFGDGFQQPVSVQVEQQGERREGRVFNASFTQIVFEVPPGRHTGPADLIIRNIDSGLETRLPNAIYYVSPIQIASITPPLGPATGGTLVRISGSGFIAPVAVTFGNIPATVLQITSTEIVVKTNAAGCNDDGPVTVINLASGDTATGPVFEYRCPRRRAA